MASTAKPTSLGRLAKEGRFDELVRAAAVAADVDFARLFERAVTDFRTIKRNRGHQQVLQWCLDQGLELSERAGWLNESMVALAARFANNEIIAAMLRRGLPECPFDRAAVGDVEFLTEHAGHRELAQRYDQNGFNLLHACAASGLGRHDEEIRQRLTEVCRLLLDAGVAADEEVTLELPVYPAFLCASYGGNVEIMRLLLDHGGLSGDRFPQTLEHLLEPHQRSGEPFYDIAELILEYGFDINDRHGHDRTLLHGAANRGTIRAVRWLLEHAADPNALDDRGRTPLHVCAARNTNTSVLKRLITAGADPSATDASGMTPLDHARENQRTKLVTHLRSIG